MEADVHVISMCDPLVSMICACAFSNKGSFALLPTRRCGGESDMIAQVLGSVHAGKFVASFAPAHACILFLYRCLRALAAYRNHARPARCVLTLTSRRCVLVPWVRTRAWGVHEMSAAHAHIAATHERIQVRIFES
eukprot:1544923-Pleurochrysis_carterae.AAC.4